MVDENDLGKWFSKAERTVIAGIGNPLRTDDFVGVKIVRDLRGKVPRNVYLIECETVPESFIQEIVDFDPTHVLLVDAAIIGKKPGESVLVKAEDLPAFSATSTHALPLRIFCDFLSKTTRAEIGLLLIQPERTDFGENLTPVVEGSARRIVNLLLEALR